MTPEQLTMNGISKRLERIRKRLQLFSVRESYTKDQVGSIHDQLIELYSDLKKLDEELRRMETVTLPANWRLVFPHQVLFMAEILKLADEPVLSLAIQDGGQEVIDKVKKALGKSIEDVPE